MDVLAGNAGDAEDALTQIETVEERTGQAVAETVGDCAFGSGATRQAFAEAEREVRAKVPGPPDGWQIPKQRFTLLWEGTTVVGVRCPRGATTTEYRDTKSGRVFTFGPECRRCPLRHQCVQSNQKGASRTLQIHPQEHLRQQAREFQASPEGKAVLRERVGVEHALARLGALGLGQARYCGRKKTRVQLLFAATVANLRWLWNWQARKGEGPTAELRAALQLWLNRRAKGGRDRRNHPRREIGHRSGAGGGARSATPVAGSLHSKWLSAIASRPAPKGLPG